MAPPVVPLAKNVFRIPTMGDFINSFVFIDDDGQVTLVDTGLKRAPKRIVRGLEAIGKHPNDVTRIVLTHAHFDHSGGAHEMTQQANLPGVEVHAADADFVRTGTRAPLDESQAGGRLYIRLGIGSFAATPITKELVDGDVIDVAGGVRVLHTPGHTPGHISLLHEQTATLITGDAIFNMNSRMRWPTAMFCTSLPINQQSANVFAELDYTVAAFTHGPEIRDNAREVIRAFLAKADR